MNELDPNKIISHIQGMVRKLGGKVAEFEQLGTDKAEAERVHAIELRKKMLVLKNENYPVTMIKDLVKGDEQIALLKFHADVAAAKHEACREAMRGIRESIGAYRSFLTWMRTEMESHRVNI